MLEWLVGGEHVVIGSDDGEVRRIPIAQFILVAGAACGKAMGQVGAAKGLALRLRGRGLLQCGRDSGGAWARTRNQFSVTAEMWILRTWRFSSRAPVEFSVLLANKTARTGIAIASVPAIGAASTLALSSPSICRKRWRPAGVWATYRSGVVRQIRERRWR